MLRKIPRLHATLTCGEVHSYAARRVEWTHPSRFRKHVAFSQTPMAAHGLVEGRGEGGVTRWEWEGL